MEREASSRLEQEAQQMECNAQRCLNMEAELLQREEKIRSLVQDLEEKGHKCSSLNLRIRSLEEELAHRSNDIEYKCKEVKQRDATIQEQTFEIEELRRMLGEETLICEKEQRQVELLKGMVMARNNTISDMESRLEKAKTVIRKMEQKLEQTGQEVKRYHDEIETLRKRSKGASNDNVGLVSAVTSPIAPKQQGSSPLVSSSPRRVTGKSPDSTTTTAAAADKVKRLEVENEELRERIKVLGDLDEQNRNTLKVARSLISGQKRFEKEKVELEEILKRKEDIIVQLTEKMSSSVAQAAEGRNGTGDHLAAGGGGSAPKSPLQSKISELNLTAVSPPKKDNEVRKGVRRNVVKKCSTASSPASSSLQSERKKASVAKKPVVASQPKK